MHCVMILMVEYTPIHNSHIDIMYLTTYEHIYMYMSAVCLMYLLAHVISCAIQYNIVNLCTFIPKVAGGETKLNVILFCSTTIKKDHIIYICIDCYIDRSCYYIFYVAFRVFNSHLKYNFI